MLWIVLAAVAALAVFGFLFWRIRRRQSHRLISFVALCREPVTFDSTVLASLVGRVWDVDVGDGSSAGDDGFVVGNDITHTIVENTGRIALINTFPLPYIKNVEQAAATIKDLRIRGLFEQHKAWFSCDAMGVDGTTSARDIQEWYRRLARLFVELLDSNCLLILLPDGELAYPVNEDTEAALKSDDPLGQLQSTANVPFIEVPSDDPRMIEAVAQARREWPRFVAAFEQQDGKNFSAKAPVSSGRNTEFIWLAVTAIEGDRIYGELGNEPVDLGSLKLGSKVCVSVTELNDWCYIHKQKGLVGGFTIEAVRKAAQRKNDE